MNTVEKMCYFCQVRVAQVGVVIPDKPGYTYAGCFCCAWSDTSDLIKKLDLKLDKELDNDR